MSDSRCTGLSSCAFCGPLPCKGRNRVGVSLKMNAILDSMSCKISKQIAKDIISVSNQEIYLVDRDIGDLLGTF